MRRYDFKCNVIYFSIDLKRSSVNGKSYILITIINNRIIHIIMHIIYSLEFEIYQSFMSSYINILFIYFIKFKY